MVLTTAIEVEAAVNSLAEEKEVTAEFLQREEKSIESLSENLAYVIMTTVNSWGKNKTIDLVPVASDLKEIVPPLVLKLKFQVRPLIANINRMEEPLLKNYAEDILGNCIINYILGKARLIVVGLAEYLRDIKCDNEYPAEPSDESSDSSSGEEEEDEEIVLLMDTAETIENAKHVHEISFFLWDLYCGGLRDINPFLACLPERG